MFYSKHTTDWLSILVQSRNEDKESVINCTEQKLRQTGWKFFIQGNKQIRLVGINLYTAKTKIDWLLFIYTGQKPRQTGQYIFIHGKKPRQINQ